MPQQVSNQRTGAEPVCLPCLPYLDSMGRFASQHAVFNGIFEIREVNGQMCCVEIEPTAELIRAFASVCPERIPQRYTHLLPSSNTETSPAVRGESFEEFQARHPWNSTATPLYQHKK